MPLRDLEYHIHRIKEIALNEALRQYSAPTLKQTQLKEVLFFKPIIKEGIKMIINLSMV